MMPAFWASRSRPEKPEGRIYFGESTGFADSREHSHRAFGPGVLHSAMAPCGPLNSLRTTPPGQRHSNHRW